MGLAIWVFVSSASAQATPGPPHIQERKEKQATSAVVAPVQQPAHPVVPIYGAAASEETLPQPPEVVWDGKQLTIDAENSKLSDILLAVRAKTGASVDFPGGATSERVAVHLGPAPVREVLSSLLYGPDFDYVIQAADDDEDGLGSVVVTQRGGKGEDVVGADAPVVAADAVKTPAMRLMRGWAAPGKPAFQAEAEAALAAKQAEADGASATETDAAVPTPGQGSADSGAESAAAGPPPANADPKSASSTSSAGSTVTVSDIPPATTASATSASSSGDSSGEQSEAAQRVQNMMNMFEQRRQIQARQNQPPTPPAAN